MIYLGHQMCFFFLNGAGPDGCGRFIPAMGELQRGPEGKEKLQHGPWN
jgi:hypothetical protein